MSKIYWSGRELIMEGVELLFGTFRNFSGEKRKYNDAGKRNFNVQIDSDYISQLIADGINVKYFKGDLEEDDPEDKPGFVRVNVNFDGRRPPELFVRYGDKGKFVALNENSVGMLDTAVFDNVDLVLNPYKRELDSVMSLYLNRGYFTVHMDPLAVKYEESMPAPIDSDEEELPF